jgi:hypothetical protein
VFIRKDNKTRFIIGLKKPRAAGGVLGLEVQLGLFLQATGSGQSAEVLLRKSLMMIFLVLKMGLFVIFYSPQITQISRK